MKPGQLGHPSVRRSKPRPLRSCPKDTGTRDSGRGVVCGDPRLPRCLVWEPLKRPGRGSPSIRLTHGAQLAPLEYTRVQAVTVICIGSQAEESEEEEVMKLR